MAAPSGIVWGLIAGGYGRIGIYTSLTNTGTTTTASVQVWFWSKYSVSDTENNLYFDNTSSAGSATTNRGSTNIKTTVASGDGWSTSNQVLLKSYSYTYTRSTSAVTRYLYAKLTDVDRVGAEMLVGTSFSVPKLDSYTITYNANGGTGTPGNQTKWYGKALTLSSTKPTRTGYDFKGWATSASGSVAYNAGASYTANADVTLYAVWEAKKYAVVYNANGGSGAPAQQTKTHGVNLTLSSTKPTRANYVFRGWGTSASTKTVAYQPGATYTANAALNLYAIWEIAYVFPIIYNLTASRCNADGTEAEDGSCGRIKFNWECSREVTTITIAWKSTTGSGSKTVTASGTSGSINEIIGDSALNSDVTYDITVTVSDSGGMSNSSTTLSGAIFPIDALAGGKGVSFGKPAELEGVADFAFDGYFRKSVYGSVMGLNKLPQIPLYTDFNDMLEIGCWAVYRNSDTDFMENMPVKRAGRLEVSSTTGEGIRLAEWSYIRQRFIPYQVGHPIYERDIARDASNVWTYYPWTATSLSTAASKKVYHEQKVLWGDDMESGMYMTAGHTANLSEKISEQASGIVLVFSYFNGASDTNWGWITRFVPKIMVALEPGGGHTFELANGKFGSVGTKYLYINDDRIVGHADNNLTGTAGSGITYANNKFVLRYVLGV